MRVYIYALLQGWTCVFREDTLAITSGYFSYSYLPRVFNQAKGPELRRQSTSLCILLIIAFVQTVHMWQI